MLKLSLLVLLLASLPEVILNLYTAMLFAESSELLKFREKRSVQKFIASVIFMLVVSYTIRLFVTEINQSIILHCIVYICILVFVYKVNIYRAVFGMSTTALFYSTIENIYMPYVIVYITKGVESYFSNDIAIILCSIPLRIAQILLIIYLRRFNFIFTQSELNRKSHILSPIVCILFTIANYGFSQAFVTYYINASFTVCTTYTIGLLLLSFFSFFILKLVFEVIKFTIWTPYENYYEIKDDTKWYFDTLYTHLKNNDIAKAKELINDVRDILD